MPPATDPVTERVRGTAAGLSALLADAAAARTSRAEVDAADGAVGAGEAGGTGGADPGAVCAWNHFENIPTFYNWNNRPR